MQYKRLSVINLSNKTVLLRLDLNTPVENSLVVNNERILRSLPTINFIIDAGAKLVIMSHLGRPEENDIFQKEFSLLPVVNELESLLNKKIMLVCIFYSISILFYRILRKWYSRLNYFHRSHVIKPRSNF